MNAPYYDIKVEWDPNACTVRLSGDVDYAASLELAPQLSEIVEECDTELVFDLSGVTLIDSEGIKALMAAHAGMRDKDAVMRVSNCSQSALRVLRMVGVDDMLGISAG
jgi:anti-anti-sigma factor